MKIESKKTFLDFDKSSKEFYDILGKKFAGIGKAPANVDLFVFAMAYGTPAGSISEGFSGSYFGTKGQIVGLKLNGELFDYPGSDKADSHPHGRWAGNQWILPHVTPAHQQIDEHHVYEDIMQLVDWVRTGTPAVASAEHARHVIEIIEAGLRAAETGQTQLLTTSF